LFISLPIQHHLHLKYVFEDTNAVIDIPPVPLSINTRLFEQYQTEFSLIEQEPIKQSKHWQFCQDAKSCLQFEPTGEVLLSSIGTMLWEKYKNQFFTFYCPDDVWAEIQEQDDIKRIIAVKFYDEGQRNSKTEHKIYGQKGKPKYSEHLVFDDGNNNNRIYYFYDNPRVYVYKTFQNEEKAKDYIQEQVSHDEIKRTSGMRRIRLAL
jgi:hypothetical protein